MNKKPLVYHAKNYYEWIWVVSLSLVGLIFLFRLPQSHWIVGMYEFWKMISFCILFFYPYYSLKAICFETYTFTLPYSKKQLLWQDIKLWFIGTALYVMTICGLSLLIEFRSYIRPEFQEIMINSKIEIYFLTCVGLAMIVLQGMGALILTAIYQVDLRWCMAIIIFANILFFYLFNDVSYQLQLFRFSANILLLTYVGMACSWVIYCFKDLEKVNQ